MDIVKLYREIKPTGFYNWGDPYEMNKKVTGILFDEIDLGSHGNSETHLRIIHSVYARRIGEIVNILDIGNGCIAEDVPENFDMEKYLNELVDSEMRMRYKCPQCGEYLKVQVKDRKLSLVEEETKKCFEYGVYHIEFQTKTDKFAFCNDIRHLVETRAEFGDINNWKGTIDSVKNYAKDGIVAVYFGNSGGTISQDTKTKDFHIYENGYNHGVSESDLVKKGYVSCGLWWIMGADLSVIDQSKVSKYDPLTIVDVEPNTTYVLEYDMSEPVHNENDDVDVDDDDDYYEHAKGYRIYKKNP